MNLFHLLNNFNLSRSAKDKRTQQPAFIGMLLCLATSLITLITVPLNPCLSPKK